MICPTKNEGMSPMGKVVLPLLWNVTLRRARFNGSSAKLKVLKGLVLSAEAKWEECAEMMMRRPLLLFTKSLQLHLEVTMRWIQSIPGSSVVQQ